MSSPLAEAFPAGRRLARELDARGWTQADFAEILGRPVQFVSEIITGKKEITRESAAQIGAALDTSAEFWLNLQDSYHLWRQSQDPATQRTLDDVRRRAWLNRLAPVSVLLKRGLIKGRTLDQLEAELQDLFELSNIQDEPAFLVAARRSNATDDLTATQLAWVACVRRQARRASVATFSEGKLKDLGAALPGTLTAPERFRRLPERFAEVGVRLVYVEQLPSSKIDGCSFMLDDGTRVIGLSGRGRRLDKVLFTLLHEVAHLTLKHVKKDDLIVEATDNDPDGSTREQEANAQATSWIVPTPIRRVPERITATWVSQTAADLGIAPIVLIGQLQNQGVLPWRTALVTDAPTVVHEIERWT
jgi:HTH-type transcriptional regulator/antitoxin HigA